jgi:SNF2 family DNA or RNA helicase
LYSQRRWLLSGTPFNASVMNLRSQCQFLQIQYMGHEFFDKTLKPLMIDRATLQRQQQQQAQRNRYGGMSAHRRNQANAFGLAVAAMSDEEGSGNDEEKSDGDEGDENAADHDSPAARARRAKRALRLRSFDAAVRAMEAPADTNKIHERTVVPIEKRSKYAVANTIFTLVCKNMMRHVRDQPYLGRAMLYDLPIKTSQVVSVPLTDKQKALYAKMLSIAQTRYKELKRRGLATRKALEVRRGKTRTRLQPLLIFPLPPHQMKSRLPLAARKI